MGFIDSSDSFRPRFIPSQWVASLGDAAIAVGFSGLELARNETEVSRDLATVLEAMGIVNTCYQDLRRPRTDAGNGSQSNDARILLAKLFEFLDGPFELRGKRVELGQFEVEFSFPEFVRLAIDHRFAK